MREDMQCQKAVLVSLHLRVYSWTGSVSPEYYSAALPQIMQEAVIPWISLQSRWPANCSWVNAILRQRFVSKGRIYRLFGPGPFTWPSTPRRSSRYRFLRLKAFFLWLIAVPPCLRRW